MNHIGYIFDSDEAVRAAAEKVERYGGKVRSQGDRGHDELREAFAYVQRRSEPRQDPDGYDVELSTREILLAEIENR